MKRPISRKTPLVVASVLLIASLGGCAQPVEKCEGGVQDLSALSNVAPQNPC